MTLLPNVLPRLCLALFLAGCLDGGPTECGNLLCPTGKVCVPAAPLCATPAEVNACAGLVEGVACAVAGQAAGTCRNTVCVAAYCGNRVVEPGEACDDGNTVGGDGCSADCRSTEVCGNGVVDVTLGEGCDCGDANATTRPPGCTGPNSDTDATQTCSTTCTPHGCGDGVVAGLEQCDGTLLDGKTCTDAGFYGGTLACSLVCRFDVNACIGRCGDGIVNGAEDCDGTGGSDTCLVENFDAGLVGCNQTLCRADTQDCRLIGWRPFRAPLIGTISAIWGSSRSDVWASASNQTALGTYLTSILHFDGTGFTQGIIGGETVAIRGTGPSDVWAVGDTVFHWDGTSWTERPTGSMSIHTAVWPFAANDVWIADGTSTLYHWNGTAYTSATVNAPANTAVSWLWGFSPTDLYAGNSTRILHYNGIGWTTLQVIASGTINQAWGAASNDMFFVGTTTVRLAGGAWHFGPVTAAQRRGIWGASSHDVYAVGDAGIDRWDGVQWLNVSPTGKSIWGADDRFVLSGSPDGLARSDGSDWHDFGSAGASNFYPYTALAVSDGNLYVSNAEISRWNSGAWQTASTSVASAIVARDDNDDVLAMGAFAYLTWTGTVWTAVAPQPPALGSPTASWADPVSFETWTVGGGGQVMRRAAGGGFTSFDQAAWGQLNAVDGVTGGPIYAVGKTVALRWNGTAWSDISSSLTTELTGVYVASASSVYAVGNGRNAVHFDGSTWTAMEPLSVGLKAIGGLADDDVFAAGSNGALWHWDGTLWSAVRTDTGVAINALRVTPFGVYLLLSDGTVRLLLRSAKGP